MARKPSSRGTRIEPRAVIVETKKGAVEFDFTEGSPLDKAFIRLWDILLISAIEMQMRAKANKQRTVQWLGRELLAEAVEMPASAIESWAVRFGAADTGAAKKPAVKKPAVKKPAVKKPAAKKPAVKKPAAKKPAVKKPAAKKPAAKKPAVKKPAVKKPAVKKPAVKKPAAIKSPTRKR